MNVALAALLPRRAYWLVAASMVVAFSGAMAQSTGCAADEVTCEEVRAITKVWQSFLGALASNRPEESLKLLVPDPSPQLVAAIASKDSNLAAFAGKVRQFHVVKVFVPLAQAYVIADTPEGERAFPMVFLKLPSGQWRISQL